MQELIPYLNIIVVVICAAFGYIIKNAIPKISNNFIPLISGVLGILITAWVMMEITPEVLATGLVSGLAATGCYELITKLINQFGKDKTND